MKQDVLEALVEAGAQSRTVVLVRNLADGHQFLVDCDGACRLEGGVRQDLDTELPQALLERSQDALARDGAQAADIEGERYLIQTVSPSPRLFIIGAVIPPIVSPICPVLEKSHPLNKAGLVNR